MQALATIITTTSASLLPDKMNDASLAVKDALFAASAAHAYSKPQVSEQCHHDECAAI
jgi:hypothetical protein